MCGKAECRRKLPAASRQLPASLAEPSTGPSSNILPHALALPCPPTCPPRLQACYDQLLGALSPAPGALRRYVDGCTGSVPKLVQLTAAVPVAASAACELLLGSLVEACQQVRARHTFCVGHSRDLPRPVLFPSCSFLWQYEAAAPRFFEVPNPAPCSFLAAGCGQRRRRCLRAGAPGAPAAACRRQADAHGRPVWQCERWAGRGGLDARLGMRSALQWELAMRQETRYAQRHSSPATLPPRRPIRCH